MLCRSVPLSSILLWAGRQQGSKTIRYHAIKRQRLHLDERFARKCCQIGGLEHDVMYFVRMRKVWPNIFTSVISYCRCSDWLYRSRWHGVAFGDVSVLNWGRKLGWKPFGQLHAGAYVSGAFSQLKFSIPMHCYDLWSACDPLTTQFRVNYPRLNKVLTPYIGLPESLHCSAWPAIYLRISPSVLQLVLIIPLCGAGEPTTCCKSRGMARVEIRAREM